MGDETFDNKGEDPAARVGQDPPYGDMNTVNDGVTHRSVKRTGLDPPFGDMHTVADGF